MHLLQIGWPKRTGLTMIILVESKKRIPSRNQAMFKQAAILFLASTSALIGMEEKTYTVTVHNKLPATSVVEITATLFKEETERKSYGGTTADILPEKSVRLIQTVQAGTVQLIIKIGRPHTYNPMVIHLAIEKSHEHIYLCTTSKQCEEVTISTSTHKLITLYAINKNQDQTETKVTGYQRFIGFLCSVINPL